jgi:hypothetical protein
MVNLHIFVDILDFRVLIGLIQNKVCDCFGNRLELHDSLSVIVSELTHDFKFKCSKLQHSKSEVDCQKRADGHWTQIALFFIKNTTKRMISEESN